MKVELDKTGMVHLVLGTYPSHDMQESLIKRNLGYRGKEGWYWDEAELKKLTLQEFRWLMEGLSITQKKAFVAGKPGTVC